MPYLNNIVNSVNAKIKTSSLKQFPSSKIGAYGIAETIFDKGFPTEENPTPGVKKYPGTINDAGEITMIYPDDTYVCQFFHKVDGIVNTINPKSSYGDTLGNLIEVANMALIVFALRDKFRAQAWHIEALIKDQFPDVLTLENATNGFIQSSTIRVGNTSFDRFGLLEREYSEVTLNLPNLMVFEMKYSIVSTWKKGCFLICGCNDAPA